jgi:hypothetical protein
MQRAWHTMSKYVPLASIVRKITDDHSDTPLGDMRSIILSVLNTSAFEATLYRASVHVVARDLGGLGAQRRQAQGAGLAVRHLWDTRGQCVLSLADDPAGCEALLRGGDTRQGKGGRAVAAARGGVATPVGGSGSDENDEPPPAHLPAGSAEAAAAEAAAVAQAAVVKAARLERAAKRLKPGVSLQDSALVGSPPALLNVAPNLLASLNQGAKIERVRPGSLPKGAMHVSEF